MNGRSSASPDGLLKSFQKSKQALSQAIGSPSPAAAAGKAASLGQDITKAFTTSPPQIANKAAPPALPSAPGLGVAIAPLSCLCTCVLACSTDPYKLCMPLLQTVCTVEQLADTAAVEARLHRCLHASEQHLCSRCGFA